MVFITLTQWVNVSADTRKQQTAGRVSVNVEPFRMQVWSFAAVTAAAVSFWRGNKKPFEENGWTVVLGWENKKKSVIDFDQSKLYFIELEMKNLEFSGVAKKEIKSNEFVEVLQIKRKNVILVLLVLLLLLLFIIIYYYFGSNTC